MAFLPYLHFDGTCAEAMAFYARVFRTDPPEVMTYAQGPQDMGLGAADRVMHSSLRLGDGALMASDFPPGVPGSPQAAVSVVHSPREIEEARRVFDALSEGGAVTSDFGPTFFSEGFGMVTDRFGTHWIIMVDQMRT